MSENEVVSVNKQLYYIVVNNCSDTKFSNQEAVMVSNNSINSGGRIFTVNKNIIKIQLFTPICYQIGDNVTISRRVNTTWQIVGHGAIISDETLTIDF